MRVGADQAWRVGQRRDHVGHAAPAWADTQKKCLQASEQARADLAEARRLWHGLQAKLDARRLIFVDETWTKTNMVRPCGRAPRGQRVIGRVPRGHWHVNAFIAGLRHDRVAPPLLLEGAMDGPTFLAWVEQFLAPTVYAGDVVVLDNLASHKATGVREAIEARGASVQFLPAYPPDLNPIEQLFAKLKTIPRGLAPRSLTALIQAVNHALDHVTAAECANYLRHAGYRQSA